jgi:hypothetical protein
LPMLSSEQQVPLVRVQLFVRVGSIAQEVSSAPVESSEQAALARPA